jgi:hypothetical protein
MGEMTWYADFATDCQGGRGEHVRAIGWLDDRHAFPRGTLDPAAVARLRQFVEVYWESVQAIGLDFYMGVHTCELCDDGHLDGRNFGVPSGTILYVCPAMITHYVEAHGYLPPAEFVAALLASPLPGTREYEAAVAPYARPWPKVPERGKHLRQYEAMAIVDRIAIPFLALVILASAALLLWRAAQ